MHNYTSVSTLAKELAPSVPVHITRKHTITEAYQWFDRKFQGQVLFAVKTNPDTHVLRHLFDAGLRHFDVASLPEIELVRSLFGQDASLYFMHTVKSRLAISEAYYTHGVRDFSLDSSEELQKILSVTDNADDLNLYVRLAIPNTYAELDLSQKFGVLVDEAAPLLQEVRQHAKKLGICFHVGSQCMHPDAYRQAIVMAGEVIREAGVIVDRFDVGGGFPSIYPGMTPPPLEAYMEAIHSEFKALKLSSGCQLICEPGRALVAEGGSVLVRVELRKGHMLYINDGTYGSLFDAGQPGFIFPARAIRVDGTLSSHTTPFSFYGPTCDSMDFMKGPFYLPSDMNEGDYIEIGQLGAYGATMRTRFNGFEQHLSAEVVDAPLMSMYGLDEDERQVAVA